MKKYIFSLSSLFFCILTASAQNDGGTAQFPDISPDVRGVGMGNTGVASSPNAFSIWRNAAKSVQADRKCEVAYSFMPWMRELSSGNDMHAFSGFYNFDKTQGITAGFRYFKHAAVDLGSEGGTFTPKDWSVDLGYSRVILDGLSVGATVRWVHSDMSASSNDAIANAFALDLGVYYRRLLNLDNSSCAVGLQLSNLGTKIDYGYEKYDQPAKLSLGGMVDLQLAENHRLQSSLDVGYRLLPEFGSFETALGLEYTAFDLFSVRGGYHFGENNNRMQRYGTVGCGMTYKVVNVDFSYIIPQKDSFLKNTWQISAGVSF